MPNHEAFNFLLEGSSSKSVDLDVLKEFAKQASAAFLSKDQSPLNFTIQKIAKVENLLPGQIDIVCQEANRIVQSEMFKTAEDHYTDFELADPGVIVSNLDKSVVKTASHNTDDDFSFAPGEKIVGLDKDFTVTKTAGHTGLSMNDKAKQKSEIEKTAHKFHSQKDELIILDAQIESLENFFVKTARQELIPEAMRDRRGKMAIIGTFCKEAGLKDSQTQHLIGLLEHVMVGQGLMEKKADVKADEKYISDNLNAKVVNGTHPLYITIKTLMDKHVRREALRNEHNLIKTKLEDYRANGAIIGQTVREL